MLINVVMQFTLLYYEIHLGKSGGNTHFHYFQKSTESLSASSAYLVAAIIHFIVESNTFQRVINLNGKKKKPKNLYPQLCFLNSKTPLKILPVSHATF